MYDPHKSYTPSDFEKLKQKDLFELFISAKNIVHILSVGKQIKKVMEDISVMRNLLKGMSSTYNTNWAITGRSKGQG